MRRARFESSNFASPPTPGAELLVSCWQCSALHRPEDDLSLHPSCEACRRSDRAGALALGMGRLHALSEGAIAAAVSETSPGNFALGYFEGTSFTVFYVGRSDSDVSACLQAWVGAPSCPRSHASPSHAPWRSRPVPLHGLGTRALGRTPFGIDTAYTHFAFCYAPSAIAAFERECRDYHELGGSEGLDNPRHPEPPPDSPWACPVHGLQ